MPICSINPSHSQIPSNPQARNTIQLNSPMLLLFASFPLLSIRTGVQKYYFFSSSQLILPKIVGDCGAVHLPIAPTSCSQKHQYSFYQSDTANFFRNQQPLKKVFFFQILTHATTTNRPQNLKICTDAPSRIHKCRAKIPPPKPLPTSTRYFWVDENWLQYHRTVNMQSPAQ